MGRPRAAGQRAASDTPARAPRRPGRPGGWVAAPAQPRPRNSRQPGPPNRSQPRGPYHTGRGHPTTRIVNSVKCTSEPGPWPGQGHRPDSSKRTGPKDLEPGRQHAQYPVTVLPAGRFSRPRDLPLPSSCRGPRYNLAVKAGVRPTAHSVPRRLSRPRDLQLPSSCRGPRYIAFCSESAAGFLPGETRPRPHSRLGHSSRTSPNGQGRGIRLSPLPESFSQPRDLPLPCSRRARAAQPLP